MNLQIILSSLHVYLISDYVSEAINKAADSWGIDAKRYEIREYDKKKYIAYKNVVFYFKTQFKLF